jgi:hypothetical protein
MMIPEVKTATCQMRGCPVTQLPANNASEVARPKQIKDDSVKTYEGYPSSYALRRMRPLSSIGPSSGALCLAVVRRQLTALHSQIQEDELHQTILLLLRSVPQPNLPISEMDPPVSLGHYCFSVANNSNPFRFVIVSDNC